jgi:Domain of unknown function (DUF4397)
MTVRKLLAQATMLAVMAGSLFVTGAAPASAGAGSAELFIVHGLPGSGKIDVCISGREVSSAVPYATRVREVVDAGQRKVKIRKASKGQCKGAVLASATLTLVDEANKTVVVSLIGGKARITSFNNNVSPLPSGENRFTAAHRMAAGTLDVLNGGDVLVQDLAQGTVSTPTTFPAGGVYSLWAARANTLNPVVGPRLVTNTDEGQAFTFVMVGSNKAKSRQIVVFKQNVGIA